MPEVRITSIYVENHVLQSDLLDREVKVDLYIPHPNSVISTELSLLLVNDGQDLVTMKFEEILDQLYEENSVNNLVVVGIHCSKDRKNEYGTAKILDYKGRGAKAALYQQFIFEELMPFLRNTLPIPIFKEKAFAGFSLGGLAALDIVWNNPQEFTKTGVFSGSLWWRDKDHHDEDFSEETDRIMHRQIREGEYYPWLKFFFEVGTMDETEDRNNNGVIDSIDDTMGLVEELLKKGYDSKKDIYFLELKNGKHDVATWAKALPEFLKWGWGTLEVRGER
jgi:enterochelin esterase-like enzyme